jgi:hypothetical protein
MRARDLPAGLIAARAILGGEGDPFTQEWAAMPEVERGFWLMVSRRSQHYAKARWPDIPGEIRCTLKANLYRAAQRAAVLLAPCTRQPS